MIPTKKLARLLLKYQKANRVRLTAYARKSRILGGVTVLVVGADGLKDWKRVYRVAITPELTAKLDADINTARLYKLECSAELRAYCKKKKYHLKWGNSNQITQVLTHLEWRLRKSAVSSSGNKLLAVMHALKLSTQPRYFY